MFKTIRKLLGVGLIFFGAIILFAGIGIIGSELSGANNPSGVDEGLGVVLLLVGGSFLFVGIKLVKS
jgi:hypothetical protein